MRDRTGFDPVLALPVRPVTPNAVVPEFAVHYGIGVLVHDEFGLIDGAFEPKSFESVEEGSELFG